MDKIKRFRSENWLDEDKNLLKELIKERVQAIENKCTDTNTNNHKKKAWVAVHDSFNSMCTGGQRTIQQLKGQWSHIKINKKKELAIRKKSIFKTGGGPPSPQREEGDITEWLPNEFIVDLNVYDSDQVLEIPEAVASGVPENIETEVLEIPEGVASGVPENIETEVLEIPEAVASGVPEIIETEDNKQDPEKPKTPKKGKEKKKYKTISGQEFAKTKIEEIAETEITLKKNLYAIKVENEQIKKKNLQLKIENEEKKKINLELEHQMLKAQFEYYKMKNLCKYT